MTDPYDPYRQYPNDPPNDWYGQQGQPGQQPYGGQYGPQQPGPYQGQPYPGHPGYQGYQGYQGGQPPPDATRQFDAYGRDPYGQDPYGQQPYQGSYGQPTGWGGGGFPPEPPKKSKAPVMLIVLLAAVILVGGGLAVALLVNGDRDPVSAPLTSAATTSEPAPTTSRRQSTTRQPTATAPANDDFEVGQCATLTAEGANRATMRVTDCGTAMSDVVIAKIEDSECADPFLSFDPGEGKFYCLGMDATEGACFRLDKLIKRALVCTGEGTRKVLKVVDGVSDEDECGDLTGTVAVYVYPDPARTICLGEV
jgi:hypothetical protein